MTILVVIEKGEEGEKLLRKAGQLATGAHADVVLLSVLSEEEFESDLETVEAIAKVENTAFGGEEVMDSAQQFAERLADEVLDDEVAWESVELVLGDGRRAARIIEVAEEHDCDHVFVLGKRRSPTGKAVFGDVTQSILLNFDGYVTVAME